MADNKIIELTEAKAPASTDLALLVADPSTNPSNKKLTLATLFNKIPSWLGLSQTPVTYTSGAIDVTTPISYISVTGTEAYSLVAGSTGQIKILVCTAAAAVVLNNITLEDNTTGGPGVIELNSGQSTEIGFSGEILLEDSTEVPDGVITPVASANDGYNTITFTDVGQSATLIYTNSGWVILSLGGMNIALEDSGSA